MIKNEYVTNDTGLTKTQDRLAAKTSMVATWKTGFGMTTKELRKKPEESGREQ